MTKRFGFTLAEVLITLGIIGVVAAMTMPTLINQTNGAQYKAAYKKALSAISQAVTLNVALDDIGFAETVAGTAGATTAPATGTSVASLLNSRMNIVSASGVPTGYTFSASTDTNDTNGNITQASADTYLFFNDGSMFAFKNADAKACTKIDTDSTKNIACKGFIDVNGLKGPNKVVTCDSGTNKAATTGENATAAVPCSVKSPTDIYPVEFYDQTILPASDAAKAVLYGK